MSNSLDHLQQFSVSGCAKGVSAQRRETEPVSQRRRLQPCCSIPCCIRQSVDSRGSSDELQPTIACALEEAAAGVRSAAARRCLGLEMEPHAAAVRSRRWSRTQPSCGGGDGGCSAPDLRRCGRAASSEGGGRRGRRRSGQGRWRRPGKERAPPSPSPSPSPSTSSRAKPKILGLLPPLLPHPLLSLSLLRPVRSMPRWCESQRRLPPWISSSSESPRRRSPAPPS
jgi:hypothetical protein